MAARAGFFNYLKKAFLYHWNLLAVGAGTAVAVITGRPDVVVPLMAAGEVAFLAALVTHPRFRDSVDAEEHKTATANKSMESAQKMKLILASLNYDDRQNYEKLRTLCIQLRRIARGLTAGPEELEADVMDDLRSSGVNRLLWIYLKLLYSKNTLDKFFRTIDEREIEYDIQRVKARLEEIGPIEEDTPSEQKYRKSLNDTLKTSELRLKNYNLAKDNYEFIKLELGRLYSKIAGLSEMSINRQDPDFITREVDSVSASVQQTEKAMDELEFITGLTSHDEMPPALLEEQHETA